MRAAGCELEVSWRTASTAAVGKMVRRVRLTSVQRGRTQTVAAYNLSLSVPTESIEAST